MCVRCKKRIQKSKRAKSGLGYLGHVESLVCRLSVKIRSRLRTDALGNGLDLGVQLLLNSVEVEPIK